jgi:hypothetical protein
MVAVSRMLCLAGILWFLSVLVFAPTTAGNQETDSQVGNDKQFHARLLKIARFYPIYGRIDDEAHWAPVYCRMPPPARPTHSRSKDEATHGRKLYSLFARDRDAYLKGTSAIGQIIVKEAWVPEEIPGQPNLAPFTPGQPRKKTATNVPDDLAPLHVNFSPDTDHFAPYVQKEGKWYRAVRRANLFVMMKLAPKEPGTDEGWVYGTVTADGKTVTAAGRIASCMKCHESQKGRLFGIGAETAK